MAGVPGPKSPVTFDPAAKKPAPAKKPKSGGINLGPAGAYTPPTKASGEHTVFLKFLKDHNMTDYANDIWTAAGHYGGITATQLAAVIYAESRGNPKAKSGVGALGIAQIYDNTANAVNAAGVPFFRADHNISNADKLNTNFSINYMAWRLSGYASVPGGGGSIDDIWVKGYNPKYKVGRDGPANPITRFLPKGYVGTSNTTISDSGTKSNQTSDFTQGLKNPYITGLDSKGRATGVNSSTPPKNAVLYDGAPLTASAFAQLKRSLESYFVTYTGKRPDDKTVLAYIQKGWGPYSLTVALSKAPSFFKSPIWKAQAPGYKAAAKDLLPAGAVDGLKAVAPGSKPTSLQNLMRTAILNQWDTTTFQAVVKQQPGYVQSNDFKNSVATLTNVHQSIMGVPDEQSQEVIQQAALAGWSTDQYAQHLRSAPEYVQSPEYQTKALSFLSGLGLLTGENPVLKKGMAPASANPNLPGSPIPVDKRLPAGHLTNPEDTIATFNG